MELEQKLQIASSVLDLLATAAQAAVNVIQAVSAKNEAEAFAVLEAAVEAAGVAVREMKAKEAQDKEDARRELSEKFPDAPEPLPPTPEPAPETEDVPPEDPTLVPHE